MLCGLTDKKRPDQWYFQCFVTCWNAENTIDLDPPHVLWQVSFGCWVTWSISSWKEYYKSVFFPKWRKWMVKFEIIPKKLFGTWHFGKIDVLVIRFHIPKTSWLGLFCCFLRKTGSICRVVCKLSKLFVLSKVLLTKYVAWKQIEIFLLFLET